MLNNQIKLELVENLGYMYPKKTNIQKELFCIYRCQCGKTFKARASNVNRGITKSCGCYQKEIARIQKTTHGFKKHRLYDTWQNMKKRVFDKKNSHYKYYGDRGITICDRWLKIENFIEDMYPTYQEGLSIDRINNDGNYEPSNCRWATNEMQTINRHNFSNSLSKYRGVTFDKNNNMWKSRIQINKKRFSIGYFKTEEEAMIARNNYIIQNNIPCNLDTL